MFDGLLHTWASGTFMQFPHVQPTRDALAASGAKAAIYGVPWEATLGRAGTNYGPKQIREVSYLYSTFNGGLGIEFGPVLNPVDCGDCHVVPGDVVRTLERAQADISEILGAGVLPVILGGDHAISIAPFRAVAAMYDDPALIHIDTHIDTAEVIDGNELSHASPIARAVDAGFDPHKIVSVGINGWFNPPTEVAYAKERGINVIWLDEIWEKGLPWALDKAMEIAGSASSGVYLTFDVDGIDGAYAPGTGVPSSAGFSSRDAVEIVRRVAAPGLIGFDVVETSPPLEGNTQQTALLAARLAVEAMAYHAGSDARVKI
jgi:agmatinase